MFKYENKIENETCAKDIKNGDERMTKIFLIRITAKNDMI